MKRFFLIACAIFLSLSLQQGMASVNLYEFSNSVDERRFQSLTRELRCPKCQNQNIADSDAPLAQDMRDLTYDMIIDGQADAQIIAFMVERYGDFVMYNPPVKPVTWLLWFSPFVLLVLILGIVFFAKGRKKKPTTIAGTPELSSEEQARLNEILQRKDS
ncbi:MAG TPA: cytochrome c-type biogenesis protein CcmH [Candidatus Ignatzschineria merdigallinarum]|uniref:Cytochrome c-type biogenesis protein n=1 Tax=Candidatus Ignatzschineria merdigallinarum TaxID=2838621 RepID=A0A9D1Q4H3_9GAMM|nr:cytochrome c-type biogenesis protein CcmH [Candidatus Ignatzschineria merdigallinarum]